MWWLVGRSAGVRKLTNVRFDVTQTVECVATRALVRTELHAVATNVALNRHAADGPRELLDAQIVHLQVDHELLADLEVHRASDVDTVDGELETLGRDRGAEHAEQTGSIELDLQCAPMPDGELPGVGHPNS